MTRQERGQMTPCRLVGYFLRWWALLGILKWYLGMEVSVSPPLICSLSTYKQGVRRLWPSCKVLFANILYPVEAEYQFNPPLLALAMGLGFFVGALFWWFSSDILILSLLRIIITKEKAVSHRLRSTEVFKMGNRGGLVAVVDRS